MDKIGFVPKAAMVSINDLLDNCSVEKGKKVLLIADVAGLCGGDSMVDADTITWLQVAAASRGADVSVLWMDEPFILEGWTVPEKLKTAMQQADVVINHSFNVSPTDLGDMRYFLEHTEFRPGFRHVRNFATTVPLLCSAWAQTPYELLMEIRYQIARKFHPGDSFELSDENGTLINGIIGEPPHPTDDPEAPYAERRRGNMYQFWPEWMHKPVHIESVQGKYVYNCMTPFWSRYMGISPYFDSPIELMIEESRVVGICGGKEAVALDKFLKMIRDKYGEDAYNVNVVHTGIHPQAFISPQACPSLLIRRQIEHGYSGNVHIHIGADSPSPPYKYFLQHCTADLRCPTFKIGNTLLHDKGHLTVLDDPEVRAVVAKYPDRPGIELVPRDF